MTAFAKPSRKTAPSWKDSSKDSDSYTFDKNLREALLLPDHALVCCVIRQVALIDSECPLVAHALKHIPGRRGTAGEDYTSRIKKKWSERQRKGERIMIKCFQQIQPLWGERGLKTTEWLKVTDRDKECTHLIYAPTHMRRARCENMVPNIRELQ